MTAQVFDRLEMYPLDALKIQTLVVESEALKSNPLKDPFVRFNPVVVPRVGAPKGGWPVVFFLSGFAGNGSKAFSDKGFDLNTVQELDRAVIRGEAPRAIYVFVDAWTFWGGSQFLNSAGMGNYQNYILNELIPLLKTNFPCQSDSEFWAVMGGSSGGYGALHLASLAPEVFSRCAAIAPDCFFEASLLPEVFLAIPLIEKMGGVSEVKVALEKGLFLKRRNAFSALNAIAMSLCYSPAKNKDGLEFPVSRLTGVRDEGVWNKWKQKDPIYFLSQRKDKIKNLTGIFLEVGKHDQYHLQYGSRQIKEILKPISNSFHYSEFDGSHNDIGERRTMVWKWLQTSWDKKL